MPSSLRARADDDHEAEHEQRVGEDRADDRELRDDDLARRQREDHDEELGQVAQRRLEHAGDRGPEVLADLLGRERDTQASPASAKPATTKATIRPAPAVVQHAAPAGTAPRSPPSRSRRRGVTSRRPPCSFRASFVRATLSSATLRSRTDGRRDLDALVLAQELERLVERELPVRHEPHEHLGRRGADVGQVLLLDRVDVEVLGARVLADDHALVDLLAGPDEHRPALLQVHQRELRRGAAAVGDERAGRPRAQLARPRLPAVEDVVEQAGAARLGEELGAEADQAARGHEVLHPHPAGAVVDHLLEPALAQREQLRDHADVVVGHVDRQPLDRLVRLAVDLAREHLRLADGELEALAAHQLDEHGELQLAAALDLPRVRPLRSGSRAGRRCRRAPGRAGRAPGAR